MDFKCTIIPYSRCSIRKEIVQFSKLIQPSRLDKIHDAFHAVLSGKSSISELAKLDYTDEERSVANRLAYLLILSRDDLGKISSKCDSKVIVNSLLQSLISS